MEHLGALMGTPGTPRDAAWCPADCPGAPWEHPHHGQVQHYLHAIFGQSHPCRAPHGDLIDHGRPGLTPEAAAMAAPLWFYEAVATGRHGAMMAERGDTEISNGSQGGQEQNALDWVGSCEVGLGWFVLS